MNWILCILVLNLYGIKLVIANYSFTYDMASRCKEHICKHGYKYENYFSADSKVRQVKYAPEMQFELHIAILAASNGHILLSTVPLPETSDPVYEIVVGGGGNKFTELRRNLRRNSKSTAKTVGILSPIEYRAFYIKIGDDGLIEFGREGDNLPLLSYFDTDPVTIKYFSFTAWNGVEAKFLYDCPVAGENESGSNSTASDAIEPKLSNSDQLKKDLLQDRIVNKPPGAVVEVKFGVKLLTARYDAFEAKLDTEFAVVVSWTDHSMAWNPTKYNGTTEIKFRQGQMWMPSFLISNSVDMVMLDSKSADLVSMVYSGEATFYFKTSLTTWCVNSAATMSKWPRDEYSCSIIIEPWNTHEIIQLEYLEPNSSKVKMFTKKDVVLQNAWKVKGKQGVVSPSQWNKALDVDDDNETYTDSDKYFIHLKLRREATAYNLVFYTPLLVLVIFLLMSFWTDHLKESKIWFYAGTATFICMGMSYIDYLVPCHSVPSILMFYTVVLFSVLLALVLNIFMMTSTMRLVYKSRGVQYFMTMKTLRALFCLAALKICNTYESINQGFLAQDDDDSGVGVPSRSSNVEEMETESSSVGEREECAEVVDKILFTVNVVRWSGKYSEPYKLECWSEAGGLTSLKLFNMYLNTLIEEALPNKEVDIHRKLQAQPMNITGLTCELQKQEDFLQYFNIQSSNEVCKL